MATPKKLNFPPNHKNDPRFWHAKKNFTLLLSAKLRKVLEKLSCVI